MGVSFKGIRVSPVVPGKLKGLNIVPIGAIPNGFSDLATVKAVAIREAFSKVRLLCSFEVPAAILLRTDLDIERWAADLAAKYDLLKVSAARSGSNAYEQAMNLIDDVTLD